MRFEHFARRERRKVAPASAGARLHPPRRTVKSSPHYRCGARPQGVVFLSEILGVAPPFLLWPFAAVTVGDELTLDS